MPIDFLTPRIDRLSADGACQTVHPGGAVGRHLRRPVLLLSRELCSFSLFSAANLPPRQRKQAASLYARATAPYVRSSARLTKAQADFGIWWWDADRVESLMTAAGLSGASPLICPESLSQPPAQGQGDSWRIVRLAHGYEAQLWRDKALLATAWRRDRFDLTSWQAFVRLQRGTDTAPDQPPAPSDLPIYYDPRLITAPVELSREKLALLAGAVTIMGSLCIAAYLSGQAWQLDKDTQAVVAHTDRIRAATPKQDAVANLGDAQKMLVAYQQLEARTNPLSASGAAIGILAYHEISPTSMEADSDILRFVISYNALNTVGAVVEDLENSGYFHDVRPRTDATAQTVTIEMKLREAAPPLAVQ